MILKVNNLEEQKREREREHRYCQIAEVVFPNDIASFF
jgi:hypothetical protein